MQHTPKHHPARWLVTLALTVAMATIGACDDGGPGNTDDDAALDTATDTGIDDVAGDGTDATPDAGDDTTGDDATPDGADVTGDTPDEEVVDDMCEPACGDNSRCTDPATDTCECITGFGDCDGMQSTGCEQSLLTVEHCGACNQAGEYCDLLGVAQVCDPTAAACDPSECQEFYWDLDGDGESDTPANGCETGLTRLGSPTALPGVRGDDPMERGLERLVWDDETGILWGIEFDPSIMIHAIEIDSAGVPTVLDSVDAKVGPVEGGPRSVGIADGFIALTRQLGVNFYQWDGSSLITIREEILPEAVSVTPAGQVLSGTRAEFLLNTTEGASTDLAWYSAYDKGSEPSGATCFTSNAEATVTICENTTVTTRTSNIRHVMYKQLGSTGTLIVIGDDKTEYELTAGPGLDWFPVGGVDVPASSPLIKFLAGPGFGWVDGMDVNPGFWELDPTTMVPEGVSLLGTVTLQETPNDFARIGDDRVAMGTDSGLVVALFGDETYTTATASSSPQATR